MAEQEREDFWGCVLTDKKKKVSWNGPSEANDDMAELDISHRLVLSQACLGPGAKKDEHNYVQVTTLDAANNKISAIIASVVTGSGATCPVHLTFSSAVTFELVNGSGPVHLSGNHIQVLNMLQSDSEDSEDEDIGSSPKLQSAAKQPSKRDTAPVTKGPPSKKAKMGEESSSEESDSEDEEEVEIKEKQKEKEKPNKEQKQTKEDVKPEEKKEQKTSADKVELPQKKEVTQKKDETQKKEDSKKTLADLVEEDSEEDEDFIDSEADETDSEDESDEDMEDEDMEDEEDDDEDDDDESDDEDESDSEEEVKPKGKGEQKKIIQNGKNKETPTKKTPLAGDNKKTPTTVKTPVSAKSTPAAKKTPQGQGDIDSIKQALLKTPNLPRKQDKFKNYMKSRFKTEDEKTMNELWSWLQKNKK